MIKKLILVAVAIILVLIFYSKFVAGTLKSFFSEKKGKVDLFGFTNTVDKVMDSPEPLEQNKQ